MPFDPELFWQAIDDKATDRGWSALSRIERRLWRLRRFGDPDPPPATDPAYRRALDWIAWSGPITSAAWPRIRQRVHDHLRAIYDED